MFKSIRAQDHNNLYHRIHDSLKRVSVSDHPLDTDSMGGHPQASPSPNYKEKIYWIETKRSKIRPSFKSKKARLSLSVCKDNISNEFSDTSSRFILPIQNIFLGQVQKELDINHFQRQPH